jgi:cob(I)alamin adenosyltransferase
MKIYTKKGDTGETSLFGGQRVLKSNERVLAYGDVDEANSFIGVAASSNSLPDDLKEPLNAVMSDLFDLGAELATPPAQKEKLEKKLFSFIDQSRITHLEKWIDQAESELPPLTHFVLPAGTEAAAALHVARTVVRRAERSVVELGRDPDHGIRSELYVYLNRVSDLLFVWARLANLRSQVAEIQWVPSEKRDL